MSILLEALRKSEKSQQPHEAPNIHADSQVGLVSEPLQTGPLALLLVAALFVSGWFVWHQYRLPEGIYKPPVTLVADKTQTVTTPVASLETVVGGTSAQEPPSNTITDNAGRLERTPVESYQHIAGDTQEPKADMSGPLSNYRPVTKTVVESDTRVDSGMPASNTSGANARKQIQNQIPEPISYWELPDAIRADVPEIKFSVLVYANKPADRFVLINGQRLGEGDSSQPGLVVMEIRREGVVFSYRLYQFLVER